MPPVLPSFFKPCAAKLAPRDVFPLVNTLSKLNPDCTEQVLRSQRFNLLAPIGDLAEKPGRLEWEAVTGVETYVIRLFEVDRTEVLTHQTTENQLLAPADLTRLIVPGKTLSWSVEALGSAGEQIATSGAEQFRLVAGQEGQ